MTTMKSKVCAALAAISVPFSAGFAPATPNASTAAPPAGDLLAIRVGRAETVSHGTIEHAVILVENGKIVTIGQDLPIERGIPVLNRPNWTVMPGLVNPYSRIGMDSRAAEEFNPQVTARADFFPKHEDYAELLKAGVTTLGEYPPGRAIPGRAIAVKPKGATADEMIIKPDAYLKIFYRSDARSKKMIKDAFAKLDDYLEKEKKAREKFEKDAKGDKKDEKKPEEKKPEEKKPDEKKPEDKKDATGPDASGGAAQDPAPEAQGGGDAGAAQDDKPAAAQDDKKDEKKDEKGKKVYVPATPDEKVKPFLDLHNGDLRALVSIAQSADYLHWLDAIGERKFAWDLRIPMVREIDVYEIKDKIGEKKCRVVMEPEITQVPYTLRQRNLAAEFAAAGAKPVLIPRSDSIPGHRQWLRAVGDIVANGLSRDVALRSVTLEPAALMGLDARLGSLDKEKDANLLFLSGDPFEAGTQVKAVMLEGKFVFGEVTE
jgi:hypothetical protein